MPKGHYIPELLAIQTWSEHPKEVISYLQSYTDMLRDALMDLESGKPVKEIRLDGQLNDVDSAIAFGSLIHEYVHHLQYTTRSLGLFFYECRYAQFLWTQSCLRELCAEQANPFIPLIDAHPSSDGQRAVLERWRKEWLAYECALAPTGMGTWLQRQGFFSLEVTHDWFRAMGANDVEANAAALPWEDMLECEAEIITAEILHEAFPNVEADARSALGEGIQAQSLRERGLHRLVPLLCDYCMQAPRMVVDNRPVNPRVSFEAAVDFIEKKFAGMEYAEIVKHNSEILATIQEATGLPSLPESLAINEDEFTKLASITSTPLGVLLQRGIQFRRSLQRWFTTPHAFIVLIMKVFPVPTWYYFNSNLSTEPNIEFSMGKLDDVVLPVVEQRLCLWAAREFAIRPGAILCPLCNINAGKTRCTGTCGFNNACSYQFGLDPLKREWTETKGEEYNDNKIHV